MRAGHHALFTSGLVALVLVAIATAQDRAPSTSLGFTVPAGFEVERVAGPPLVDRPIVADFDEEGRLYVADSSGSSERVEKQLADRPHRIVRLEDIDEDGVFDKSVVFADRMMLPEGTMWFDGSLYVAAPPSIWRLTDTNGDGVADQREEWFRGETLTGCANDLHGPYLGPDGWIYWTKGAFAQQTHARDGRPALVTRAAHVFRRRPGTSAVEVVLTGGMDNPVDVAFTPAGERILTATFVEHPQAGRRDGLLHAVYGGVYGKPHGVIDGHPRTGDLMPIMCQLGPAVPAGLTRYASRVFGDDYQDNFFAALFNLRKVARYTLEPAGATFNAKDADFLVSESRDFHPTDVVEDADGSLLVIDTGPWYKLCCPTSQLAKPQVLGAIYRVRRVGRLRPNDPYGRTLPWNTMTPAQVSDRLDGTTPFVQRRAMFELSKTGADAVPALAAVLRGTRSPEARRNAVWALTRIEGNEARATVRSSLEDPDDTVRQAAIHSAGLWRDAAAVAQIVRGALHVPSRPALQRSAAEALGRIGDAAAVPDLVRASALPADPVLEHSLAYALIEIGDATAIASVQISASRARRIALIARDQIGGNHVTPAELQPLLRSADPVLRETAWWIATRHPEWGAELVGFFEQQLRAGGISASERGGISASERDVLVERLTPFTGHAVVQQMLAEAIGSGAPGDHRQTALRVMARAFSTAVPIATRMKELPPVWSMALAKVLPNATNDVTRQLLGVARAAPSPPVAGAALHDALMTVARDQTRPPDVRFEALSIAGGTIDNDLFQLARTAVGPTSPAPMRSLAATALQRAALSRNQLLALVPSLESAGPLERSRLLSAFDPPTVVRDEALGLALVQALARSSSRSSLRPDLLRPRLEKYPEAVRAAGEALLVSAQLGSANEAKRLETLVASAVGGDAARGQVVFNSDKGACLSCHTIGYVGGKIGPDLTRIGQVRGERDLVEAIAFPSVSFARGYEPVTVRTRSGELVNGSLRSDGPDEVVLSDVAGNDIRIPRRDMLDMQPGAVSLMPPGFGELFSREELADLVAFLQASR